VKSGLRIVTTVVVGGGAGRDVWLPSPIHDSPVARNLFLLLFRRRNADFASNYGSRRHRLTANQRLATNETIGASDFHRQGIYYRVVVRNGCPDDACHVNAVEFARQPVIVEVSLWDAACHQCEARDT